MKTLSYKEVRQVSGGGQYSDWQVVAVSSLSSGVAFASIRAHATASFTEALPYLLTCSIPTALVTTILLGGLNVGGWLLSSHSTKSTSEPA